MAGSGSVPADRSRGHGGDGALQEEGEDEGETGTVQGDDDDDDVLGWSAGDVLGVSAGGGWPLDADGAPIAAASALRGSGGVYSSDDGGGDGDGAAPSGLWPPDSG